MPFTYSWTAYVHSEQDADARLEYGWFMVGGHNSEKAVFFAGKIESEPWL